METRSVDTGQSHRATPLFLVRLWADDVLDEPSDVQGARLGKVLHVVSGEAHYFRDWAGLVAILQEMLSRDGAAGSQASITNVPTLQSKVQSPKSKGPQGRD
jgi:hypothetical protein